MQPSHFQFSSPKLLDFHYTYNVEATDKEETEYRLNADVKCKREDGEPRAQVLVTINTQDSEELPFAFSISMCASFIWDEHVSNPEKLLRYNAPALLLGYMRPIIASVTSFSPVGTFDMPFIDFTNDISDETMIHDDNAPEE